MDALLAPGHVVLPPAASPRETFREVLHHLVHIRVFTGVIAELYTVNRLLVVVNVS
jgi:hypothetical protein